MFLTYNRPCKSRVGLTIMAGLHCIYRLQKRASPISRFCVCFCWQCLCVSLCVPALSLVLSLGGVEGRQFLCACVHLGYSVAGDLACAFCVPHPGSDGCRPVFALRCGFLVLFLQLI